MSTNHSIPSSETSYLMPSSSVKLSKRELRAYIKEIESSAFRSSNGDEIHACCVRLWLLFKRIEDTNSWPGRFGTFCKAVDESQTVTASYILSLHVTPKYSASVPHRWASGISRRWLKRGGPEVIILMFPNGTLVPTPWLRNP